MYANVIIDISHEKVDRVFEYRIPPELEGEIKAGVQVWIPFGAGNHLRKGYVVETMPRSLWKDGQVKDIAGIVEGSVTAESQLIQLAWWMKERYGSTMNQALKTVLPVKQKVRRQENRCLICALSEDELEAAIDEAAGKSYRARERLLKAFRENVRIPYGIAVHQMHLTAGTLKPMIEKGQIRLESETVFRNPQVPGKKMGKLVDLNPEQQAILEDFRCRYDEGIRETSLIYGITGSGKTEVYMEMIDHVLARGRQVIVLIPEIALTYQTVLRFYRRFGEMVSVVNSRLSAGERYDQFERARNGQVRVMIGPRSALFTPFSDLGLIIIDEEHESAYKSELSPRYHARETAWERARLSGASLVLGSATPSLEAYSRALAGVYRLYRLRERASAHSRMAEVSVVDLRQELKDGNKSIFSRRLQEAIERELGRKHQIMLFLNRRGYSNFMSCRSCGQAVKCPHCDVTLTLHRNGRLKCHYCGYETAAPAKCPACGSPYIAGFGTGTQKIEAAVRQMFPQAGVLRMDLDTTSKKGGHEEILSAFADGRADILVGTQMIVKGHDFPNVTLVGILAADLSLYSSDFRCGERTFQLLTQAAGRAGRREQAGQVIIQTYSPDHYAITAAARQDYDEFFEKEMAYRRVLHYPPEYQLLSVTASCGDERLLNRAVEELYRQAEAAAADCRILVEQRSTAGGNISAKQKGAAGGNISAEQRSAESGNISAASEIQLIGPAEAPVYKVNDIYRKILYLKHENYDILIRIKDRLEQCGSRASWSGRVAVQYDFA